VLELGWRRKRRKEMGRFLWFRVFWWVVELDELWVFKLLRAKLAWLELVLYYTHFRGLEPTGGPVV